MSAAGGGTVDRAGADDDRRGALLLLLPPLAWCRRRARRSRRWAPGRIEVIGGGPGTVRLRYASASDDGRERCQARQRWALETIAQAGGNGTVLREDQCLALGDACCEYVLHWSERARTKVVLGIGLAGLSAAVVVGVFGLRAVGGMLAIVPAAMAYALERWRVHRGNRTARREGRAAFRWLLDQALVIETVMPSANRATAAAPPETARHEPAGQPALPSLEQDGEFWRISFGGTTVLLRHSRGLALLAHLIRYAGRELHVRELDAMTPSGGSPLPREAPVAEPALAGAMNGDTEALDARAAAEYRARVIDLRAELTQAEEWQDLGRAERIRTELAALAEQLETRAAGRRNGDDGQRLRPAITRRIRDAMTQIAKHHPALGEHLQARVSTGYFCSYRPDAAGTNGVSAAKLPRARLR